VVAYHDTEVPQHCIRHSKCELVVLSEGGDRCFRCDEYRYGDMFTLWHAFILRLIYHRKTLHVLYGRQLSRSVSGVSSHANFRYLTTPEKISRLHEMRHHSRNVEVWCISFTLNKS